MREGVCGDPPGLWERGDCMEVGISADLVNKHAGSSTDGWELGVGSRQGAVGAPVENNHKKKGADFIEIKS